MTQLVYLEDSYKKSCTARVLTVRSKPQTVEITLDKTVLYPQGGGQPSDRGTIIGKRGKAHVKHVKIDAQGTVIHECVLEGEIKAGEQVTITVDWNTRYINMRVHSAGHIIHEAVMHTAPNLLPRKADHGNNPFIEYEGSITVDKVRVINDYANEIVQSNVPITSEFVTLEVLQSRSSYVPTNLPKNKPLRIITVGKYPPIPDGGTQVASTGEVGHIDVVNVEHEAQTVRVYYQIERSSQEDLQESGVVKEEKQNANDVISELIEVQSQALIRIQEGGDVITLRNEVLGKTSEFARVSSLIRTVPKEDIRRMGIVINEVKQTIERALSKVHVESRTTDTWFDTTAPAILPPQGHLHIVTQAITEITRIFERIGFTRVRHPEVDWDWYAFEALNMPQNHPARDEWETFFIKKTGKERRTASGEPHQIVLTPHTSNGQVREMEKGLLPIRMINIAKCYRRQSDISHAPMFYQFEGLYVDKNVSIAHLKGVCDYFFKEFYGQTRKSRLRPFHFQFTEPSFEIDVSCGLCGGTGILPNDSSCKLCKEGWLELGGAGMVHPNVLKAGGIDSTKYQGFAFGWGVERTYMMKTGTQIDDVRLLYGNDVRFLEQF